LPGRADAEIQEQDARHFAEKGDEIDPASTSRMSGFRDGPSDVAASPTAPRSTHSFTALLVLRCAILLVFTTQDGYLRCRWEGATSTVRRETPPSRSYARVPILVALLGHDERPVPGVFPGLATTRNINQWPTTSTAVRAASM